MLEHLRARNLGPIRDGEINPGRGLTVITGETGAGKTLLLGALRLLLGEQADSGIVGPFADYSQADGLFVAGDEIAVSRVIPAEGRSRAYRDGVIVSAEALSSELGGHVQIVGQHDRLELKKGRHILALLDENRDNKGHETRRAYDEAWDDLSKKLGELDRLGGSQEELARELDLARYQHNEISKAAFRPGEEQELDRISSRLRNAEEIKEHLAISARVLTDIADRAGELVSHLRKVASLDEGSGDLTDSAESLAIVAGELSREIVANAENVVDDAEAVVETDRRLTLLGDLKVKYGRTIEEILKFGDEAGMRVGELADLLARATSIDREVEAAKEEAARRASALTKTRRKVANSIEGKCIEHLKEVGLGAARVSFEFERTEPGPHGSDRVAVHFSSHDNLKPGPISKVASGGELSRLILAISLSTGTSTKSTLIFDEVDAGVGGGTALAMGRKLADLATDQQVLCVTHLPQVAAFADTHYVISRAADEATVTRVEGSSRLEELSRMIAGLPESDRGQQAAVELLEMSGK